MKDKTDDAISKAWRNSFGTRDTRLVRREVAKKLKGVIGDRIAGDIVWGVHRQYYSHDWLVWELAVPDIGRDFLKAVAV